MPQVQDDNLHRQEQAGARYVSRMLGSASVGLAGDEAVTVMGSENVDTRM